MKRIISITTVLGSIGLVSLTVFGALLLWQYPKNADATITSQSTFIGTATTSAAITVTSSTRILATTTNPLGVPGVTSNVRVYATICNPSATVVYLRMDLDKKANILTGGAFPIAAAAGYNACFEITDRNLTQGSIQASSTNETSTTVYVQDYTQ